ncbi:hypothetical protein NDU88_005487 [Pleurodeles waltl]|uniref:Uncharacterized protein n=1 Tax=Pleurodeles waltl TaxID=8319 RepID=A0AAV7TBI4_PLEWA|nr:hypothetical protein NDU88_005487 [Pleurodeles waltl]
MASHSEDVMWNNEDVLQNIEQQCKRLEDGPDMKSFGSRGAWKKKACESLYYKKKSEEGAIMKQMTKNMAMLIWDEVVPKKAELNRSLWKECL